ncbi:MAG: DUF503 domain-containing protein [Anaerolineales bacterium]|nr:DUF503 domain-containing protein [Anaerolineales bacterium]
MSLGLLTLHLSVPGCMSLKEKRSRLKPLLARLHREFNISVAEMAHQDSWQNAVVACAMITSDTAQTQRTLQGIVEWVETYWPDLEVADEYIEML